MTGIGNRRQIKLVDESPVLTGGKWVASEITILREWAEVKNNGGSRSVQNDQTLIGKFFEFKFRYRGDINLNVNVKLEYNGKRHTIQSLIRESEKNFYWILRADVKSFN